MKLDLLLTALALPLTAANTLKETAQPNPETLTSWGTDKDFSSIIAGMALGGLVEDDQRYHCNTAPPNPECYINSYPRCCTRDNCPRQPSCECEGDCRDRRTRTGQSFCTWSPDFECYEKGWPQCCSEDGQQCPSEQPSCDIQSDPGSDTRTGQSFCTWSPDFECYEKGWPQCCSEDGQQCPSEQPRCDVQRAPGWDYCTWGPDYTCYASGRPACCSRFGGTNCPRSRPNCDTLASDNLVADSDSDSDRASEGKDWDEIKDDTKRATDKAADWGKEQADKVNEWGRKTFNSATGMTLTLFSTLCVASSVQFALV